jgi:hypothetical protein
MPESGVTTGPPDFIGVGTQRSGTTWMQRLLIDHPRIQLPLDRRKEQHFFDWFGKTEMTDADVERYHRSFPHAEGEIAGDWTPRYMRDIWTPRLIPRAAPEAKILVIFRDPVERYRSGVLHTLARRGGRAATYLATDAVERGRYALQLKRVFDYFDRNQVLVLQFERGLAEPLEQYHRTLEFIGLPPDHVPTDLTRTRGTPQSAKKEPFWDDFKEALVRELEPDVAELREMVPEIDVELWPNFRHLATGGQPEIATEETAPISVGSAQPPKGRPPDFIGVGTSDSCFAWWHRLLLAHPSIQPPIRGRSLEFFETFCTRAMTGEDVQAYHAHFDRPADEVVGEWSPDYMYDIWTPMLLKRAAPDAKLIVMLLDPVTRFRASIADSWRRRSADERTHNRAAETDFLSNTVPRGRYASQLRGLFAHFPHDQVLVLQHERCVEDPAGEYARTLRFLGVDEGFRPDRFREGPLRRLRRTLGRARRRVLGGEPDLPELWPDVEIPLLAELEPDVLELRKLVPDLDLSLWPSFAHLAVREAVATAEPGPVHA